MQPLNFLSHRLGWEIHLKPFLYKKLPAEAGWRTTLGSLAALLFTLMAVSGMGLALFYNPSPDHAYTSVDYIMNDVPLGRLLRGIHHFGAGAMVIVVFTHLLVCFFEGAFRPPREITWISGVMLLFVTLGLGFTGYLLPWDQKAYWATVVSANILRDVPLMGDLGARLLLAGDGVSGLTLTRFFALHVLLLPALLASIVAFHIYLVRLHGIASNTEPSLNPAQPSTVIDPDTNPRPNRFYPEHLARATVVFTLVFILILILAQWGPIKTEPVAGADDDSYLPRPEWNYLWLFQMLTFFPGAAETIGSVAIPAILTALLLALPFLGKNHLRNAADRPVAVAVAVALVVGMVFLTVQGLSGTRPYGDVLLLPDRALKSSEIQGLQTYMVRDCAYCHQIRGEGGRREGPDLASMHKKGRTTEGLTAFIRNPQAQSRWATMPAYDLTTAELNGLADFILALDFSDGPPREVSRAEAMKIRNTGNGS